MTIDNLADQVDLIAGEFSEDITEFLGGNVEPFVLASRARRHLWLALLDIAPAAARSGLVRHGWDAEPSTIINWVLEDCPLLLWAVLRRCMPAPALPRNWYFQLATQLRERPRTGRVLCQLGSMNRNELAVTLALPSDLIEPSVIALMRGNVTRAEAVRDLWSLALDQGRNPLDLRRAICDATDMDGLEGLLIRSVQGNLLPVAPVPDDPAVLPIRTARQLSHWGHSLRNCTRSRGGLSLRDRSHAFFIWLGDVEGDVMVRCAPDHLGWRIAEARLTANRPPSERLYRRIAAAFESVGVRHRPDLSDLLMAL